MWTPPRPPQQRVCGGLLHRVPRLRCQPPPPQESGLPASNAGLPFHTPRRLTDPFPVVCATLHSSVRRAALLRRSWLFLRAPRRLSDRFRTLPANGRARSSYLLAHATQCLPAAADQPGTGEESGPPPTAKPLVRPGLA